MCHKLYILLLFFSPPPSSLAVLDVQAFEFCYLSNLKLQCTLGRDIWTPLLIFLNSVLSCVCHQVHHPLIGFLLSHVGKQVNFIL